MNRIDAVFKRLRDSGRKGLIPFITAGDPDLETTEKAVLEIAAGGADIIELGIPFSDPLADGPTIQKSSLRSLTSGHTSLAGVLELVRSIRKQTGVPICFMSYYNPIFSMGEDNFFERAGQCGVDGVIIPDLPPEEAEGVIRLGAGHDVKTVFLAAPTSPPERLKLISECSTGFIYFVSLTGITGVRNRLSADLEQNLEAVRAVSDKPVAVGFGISGPETAFQASQWADGVIIGSALVKIFEKYQLDGARLIREAGSFIQEIRKALDNR
ncbi:MAG: tryptophan synthase subunit alpha [bacterium]